MKFKLYSFLGLLLAVHSPANLTVAGALLKAAPYVPSSVSFVLHLALGVGMSDLSAVVAWRRVCLILAGDIEMNPGPYHRTCSSAKPPSSVFTGQPGSDSSPYTDKSVS